MHIIIMNLIMKFFSNLLKNIIKTNDDIKDLLYIEEKEQLVFQISNELNEFDFNLEKDFNVEKNDYESFSLHNIEEESNKKFINLFCNFFVKKNDNNINTDNVLINTKKNILNKYSNVLLDLDYS